MHETLDLWNLCVSPEHFDQQMQVLEWFARPVPLDRMGARIGRPRFGLPQVSLTFDDAYADTFENAKPVLLRRGRPATFFVVSDVVENHSAYWWDELAWLILGTDTLPPHFEMEVGGEPRRWEVDPTPESGPLGHVGDVPDSGSALSRSSLYYCPWEILSSLSPSHRAAEMERLGLWAGTPRAPKALDLPMTPDQLRSLACCPRFDIGSHSRTHTMLSRLSPPDQEGEIAGSKQALEGMLDRRVTAFSYPHGACSAETPGIIQRWGFETACTVEPRLATRHCSSYAIPRFMVLDWGGDEFERALRTWLDGTP